MPRRHLPHLLGLAALLPALAACGDGGAEAPGGVSQGEAEALEDAADMLDERRLPPEALPPGSAAPSGAAAAEMTGDSTRPSGQ